MNNGIIKSIRIKKIKGKFEQKKKVLFFRGNFAIQEFLGETCWQKGSSGIALSVHCFLVFSSVEMKKDGR